MFFASLPSPVLSPLARRWGVSHAHAHAHANGASPPSWIRTGADRIRSSPGRSCASLMSVCAALASLACQAQPSLSLDQALHLAQDRSHQLLAQDAAAAAAREMAVAAGQRPDPTLRFGINNLPIDGADRFSLTRDFMTMRSLGVGQELTRSDKLAARSARFDREADAAVAARALALARLRRETALAWLERHFNERMLVLLRSQRVETGLQVEAADAVYRGGGGVGAGVGNAASGRGSQADVFAARSAVALIDDRIRQSEAQIAAASIKLARWVGDAAAQPLGAAPALDVVLTGAQAATLSATLSGTRAGTLTGALTHALPTISHGSNPLEAQLAHHPEIAMLRQQEAMARADADIAQRNQRADWSVELMFSQRGPSYSNMLSLNLSIPLQIDPQRRQQRELAAKLALVDQLRAQREEATREHLAEARSWLHEWRSLRDRVAGYDRTLIPLAAQRTQAATVAYRGGAGALSAALEARRGEIDTRMDRLRLEMEAATRWAQLEYLIPPGHDVAAERPLTNPVEK